MAHKQLNSKAHSSVGKHPDHPSHPARSLGRVGYAEEPSDHSADGFSAPVRRLILPPIVSAVTGVVAVTVITAFAVGSADPTFWIEGLSPLVTALASLAGGITAGLCHRRRAAASAILYGGILAGILCAIGLLAKTNAPMDWLTRLLPLPICAMGGFLTRPKPPKAGHHPH